MKLDFNGLKMLMIERLASVLDQHDCQLYDINRIYEFDQDIIQIMIENKSGVDMDFDKLNLISEAINTALDSLPEIGEVYAVEITTPGLERPLRNWADFVKASGQYIHCEFMTPINSYQQLEGELCSINDDAQTFKLIHFVKGVRKETEATYSNVASARWAVKF